MFRPRAISNFRLCRPNKWQWHKMTYTRTLHDFQNHRKIGLVTDNEKESGKSTGILVLCFYYRMRQHPLASMLYLPVWLEGSTAALRSIRIRRKEAYTDDTWFIHSSSGHMNVFSCHFFRFNFWFSSSSHSTELAFHSTLECPGMMMQMQTRSQHIVGHLTDASVRAAYMYEYT